MTVHDLAMCLQGLNRRIGVVEEWIRAQQRAGLRESRLTAVSDQVTALRRQVEDAVAWSCEYCGFHNAVPRLIAAHVPWQCEHCHAIPKDDLRRFYMGRRLDGPIDEDFLKRPDGPQHSSGLALAALKLGQETRDWDQPKRERSHEDPD